MNTLVELMNFAVYLLQLMIWLIFIYVILGWLVAFILYKPAAAIVYAAAFQLAGTNVFQDDGTGFIAVLTGLILMVLALFAMPALMRFVTPLVGAMSAGAGGTTTPS